MQLQIGHSDKKSSLWKNMRSEIEGKSNCQSVEGIIKVKVSFTIT